MSPVSALHQLLFTYTNTSDESSRSRIKQEVWQTFGITGAVFVLDMSGFSRTSQDRGIVYYLALLRRMQIIVEPIIQDYSGTIVKFEADNCFAWFPNVEPALDAAINIQTAIAAANRTTPEELDIEVCCGIDYGDFLLIGNHDFFGIPVNYASKLGEDVGEAGEILVTQAAMAQVKNQTKFAITPRCYEISGLTLSAYQVLRYHS